MANKYRVPVLGHFCWQEPVKSMGLNAAPTSGRVKGDRYIVAPDTPENGDPWSGHANEIAWFDGADWNFDAPDNGWKCFVDNLETFFTYDFSESSWIKEQLSTLVLGLPTDGIFTDGLLDFSSETSGTNAIDDINEVLKDIAPPNAESLSGKVLVDNVSFVSGKLPTGLPADYYVGVTANGATINTIIHQNNLTLSSPDTNKCFNWGDKGFLKVKHIDGVAAIAEVAILDIPANFVEPDPGNPRAETQTLSLWDNPGTGDTPTDAIIPFHDTTAVGTLQVLSCGGYKGELGTTPIFNMWQKMTARINVTTLPAGYNGFKLAHDGLSSDQESAQYDVYYDNNTDVLSFSVPPTIVEKAINSSKYISGVRYYSSGDTFDVAFTGNNLFKNCYSASMLARHKFEACSANTDIPPSGSYDVNDTLPVTGVVTINRGSYYDLDTRLTAYLYHPWKTQLSLETPSENRMVCTYDNVSTDVAESFRDENHRLDPASDYDSAILLPGSITGQWNSQNPLAASDALVYNQRVQLAAIDLSGNLPIGPNYTVGRDVVQQYCRAFYKNEANSNVSLTLTNLNIANIGEVGNGDVNVEIKLPTQTGWLDAGKAYSSALFTGIDGDGCKTPASTGSILSLTFGTFTTANSGQMIIVRITFRNTNQSITALSVNW